MAELQTNPPRSYLNVLYVEKYTQASNYVLDECLPDACRVLDVFVHHGSGRRSVYEGKGCKSVGSKALNAATRLKA